MFLLQSFRSLVLLMAMRAAVAAAADEPKRDRFGDPLPQGAIARLGSLHLRHDGAIRSAAFTADGKTLATCEWLAISFWDRDTGKCVRRVPLKRNAPDNLRRFSNDAKVLMMDGHDNVLHFVDAATGEEQATLNHIQCGPLWGKTLQLSRDGKILATIHRSSIALWDVPNNTLLREFKDPSLERGGPPHDRIALMPDGKQLVLPHADGSLHLVDVASGNEVRAFEMPPSRQGVRRAFSFERVTLSPDGRYLAFGGGTTPLTLCEVATGKRISQLGQIQGSTLAFTPNGRFLAVDGFNELRIFGVLSGKEIRKMPKKRRMPSSLMVFSPDGRTLAAFPTGSTIPLWDVVAQRRLNPPIGHEIGVKALAFFPDGKRLVSADQSGEMRVWDIASGQSLAQRNYNYGTESLTVDRDGDTVRFAGHDGLVHQWNLRSGRDEVGQKVVAQSYTHNLALSPDGRSLATLAPKGAAPQKRPAGFEFRLYDLKTNKPLALQGIAETSGVRHFTFTPDSRRVAVNGADFALRLWDRDTGKLVRELKDVRLDGPPIYLVFAADGRSFAGFIRNMVYIREVVGGADRLQLPPPHGLYALAYSPNAGVVALGDYDGQIVVYSAGSGRQLAQLQGKQGTVRALAFSRDGRFLACGGANGTIVIWKVPHDDLLPVIGKVEALASLWLALGDSDVAAANRIMTGLADSPALALALFHGRLPAIGRPTDQKKDGDSQRLRALRAIEVLERIGTTQAKELLRDLAGKPLLDELKEEVQASLQRMSERL